MSQRKFSASLTLTVVSSILILVNGLWIVANGAPIIISSFDVGSVNGIMSAESFWGRIAFGLPEIAEGSLAPFWLVPAGAMLLCAFIIYRKPRRQRYYGPWIAIFSLLSIPIGGGFYAGALLGFIGGVVGFEWPQPFKETFFGKIFRASTFDSRLYNTVYNNPATLGAAAFTVMFASILSGIGNGLYTYNLHHILEGGELARNILLKGQLIWELTPVLNATAFIGITVLRWLVLSLAIYWIGSRITGVSSDYSGVTRVAGFALVPLSLQMLLPIMFSNEPTLSINWPLGLYLLSTLWVFAVLVVATAQIFEFSKKKALGTMIFAGAIYWLIDNTFIIPTLDVPGVRLELSTLPSSLPTLLILSAAVLIALILGVFSRE